MYTDDAAPHRELIYQGTAVPPWWSGPEPIDPRFVHKIYETTAKVRVEDFGLPEFMLTKYDYGDGSCQYRLFMNASPEYRTLTWPEFRAILVNPDDSLMEALL